MSLARRPAGAGRSGGALVVDQLLSHGVDTAFCVPGESYLAVLDACYAASDRIALVSCRHESGAAYMADAYGKLTGRPGVCLVSRGPGAMNASVGVHVAAQDSTPLLVLVGQVPTSVRGREAFQELDVPGVFGPIAKWAVEVDRTDRLPEVLARALALATAGRPGPVVVSLPEDVLAAATDAEAVLPGDPPVPGPSAADLDRLAALLRRARRPLVLAGGAGWSPRAAEAVGAFATASGLAVATSFRYQDAVDNELPTYVGDVGLAINPALAARLEEADLVVALGPRLGDVTTAGYTRLRGPEAAGGLVHVHPDPAELGRVYRPALAIAADVTAASEALAGLPAPDPAPWRAWVDAARRDYLAWRTPPEPGAGEGHVDLGAVMVELRRQLPPDAIIASGAGNYTGWVHRFLSFSRFRTQLAPTGGAMGYGFPAALAAKVVRPDREVVAVAGDGCFLMAAQELATAVGSGLPVVVLVVNNHAYGTIRLHQERRYPGRPIGTDLHNPDFAAYARAFGAHGEVVTTTEGFPAALERARGAGRPALLELRVDPGVLTPTTTLAALRAARP